MVKKLFISFLLLAGTASLHAAWKYNPFTSRLDYYGDISLYSTYDSTNYEVDFSTSVNITGRLLAGSGMLDVTSSSVTLKGAFKTGGAITIPNNSNISTPANDFMIQQVGTVNTFIRATDWLKFTTYSGGWKSMFDIGKTSTTVNGILKITGAIYNIEDALTDSTIVTADIKDGEILEADLNFSNSPTDNYLASYNAAGGNFTWVVSPAGGGGGASTLQVSVDGVEITSPTATINLHNVFEGVANGAVSDIFVSTAAPTNGDTTHLCNGDQIYDFVDGSYLSKSSSTATNLHIDIAAATYEPIVTEGSLADSTIVSADIKDATILYNDVSSTFTLAGSPNLPASRAYWATTGIIFEGATANAFETLFTVTDPTADRTITFPDSSITVAGLASAMTGTYDGNNFGGGAIGQGDILYGSAAGTISELAKDANATRYLSNTGASNNPAWAQVNLTNGVSGLIPVANIWGRVGTANSTVAAGTHTHTGVYEPVVTEGSLADSVIVSADIKDDTIDSADYAADSIDPEHLASNIDPGTDFAICISTPYALGTVATLISPFRNYAVTITTISASTIGGTNVVLMVEQRTIAGINSAGTDIWGGDLTAVPTLWTGLAASDFTVPAGSALVLVPTSVSGAVDRLMIKGRFTVD